MQYHKTIPLKDGRTCVLRNGTAEDGQALLDIFNLTHAQTDYLLTYPEEHSYTAEDEAELLRRKTDSVDEIELLAFVDGAIVGSAGVTCVARREKTRHRAEFGISVDKAFWGLGIGRALTEACIECAETAGYTQLELEAVAENKSALALYKSVGFREYGRNPKGFRSRLTGWQELVLMRLELGGKEGFSGDWRRGRGRDRAGIEDRVTDEGAMTKTERLRIYPASREQMEAIIASETDAELKKAYTEMLDGCLRHPDQWDWYAMWMIEKADGTPVGDLCFKGLREDGIAEIGYGILEEYQGQGYATEAVQAACRWAFLHPDVRSLEAETDVGNAASQRVLEKCGFRPNGTSGEEGPRFSLAR